MGARLVRYSSEALEEYRAVFRESIRLFGVEQAERYSLQIDSALETIADNPEIGVGRDNLIRGLRRFKVSSHFVYYQHSPDEIRVIHIYHQRQSEELGDWETDD